MTQRHGPVSATPITRYLRSTLGRLSGLSLGQSSARTPSRDVSPLGIATRPTLGAAGEGACRDPTRRLPSSRSRHSPPARVPRRAPRRAPMPSGGAPGDHPPAISSRRRRFTSGSASSKLANAISVLHRSQSMAGPPLILVAVFIMAALLQPLGNPSGVLLTRVALRGCQPQEQPPPTVTIPGAGTSCSTLDPSGAADAASGAVRARIAVTANPRSRIFRSPPVCRFRALPIAVQPQPPAAPCGWLALQGRQMRSPLEQRGAPKNGSHHGRGPSSFRRTTRLTLISPSCWRACARS
jgi:hypothetical protein